MGKRYGNRWPRGPRVVSVPVGTPRYAGMSRKTLRRSETVVKRPLAGIGCHGTGTRGEKSWGTQRLSRTYVEVPLFLTIAVAVFPNHMTAITGNHSRMAEKPPRRVPRRGCAWEIRVTWWKGGR